MFDHIFFLVLFNAQSHLNPYYFHLPKMIHERYGRIKENSHSQFKSMMLHDGALNLNSSNHISKQISAS